MTDRIVLTLPTDERLRSVATLVLGGVGSRLDLPFERMDDLQLAVLSALDAADGGEVTLELEADERALRLAIGPMRADARTDDGLGLVLSRLVDGFSHEKRDDDDWLSLHLSRSAPAVA